MLAYKELSYSLSSSSFNKHKYRDFWACAIQILIQLLKIYLFSDGNSFDVSRVRPELWTQRLPVCEGHNICLVS